MNGLLAAALELQAAGYSVLPIKTDGTKAPAVASWKQYTTERADVDALDAWFGGGDPYDLGVVQGAVSGAAELTEVEGRAAAQLPDLRDLAIDSGLGDLWDMITRGWVEMSPSGGFHFHYRLTDGAVPGNLKLARAADKLVLAETRGEGGQVVVAPSRHHTTGRPWVRLAGGPATAATITLAQRDAFHSILRTLDQMPDVATTRRDGTECTCGHSGFRHKPHATIPRELGACQDCPCAQHQPAPSSAPRAPGEGITPGDDYENKVDWADILTPHGWTLVSARGRTRYWLRPGKQRGQGISATTGHADDRDRLFVFTSSTDFAQEIPYTKLGAYAVLEHGGDHAAAAKALYAAGYGQRNETPRLLVTTETAMPGGFFDDILSPPATVHIIGGTTPALNGTRPAQTGTPTPLAAPPAPAIVAEPATYTATDDGNALRLIDTHGHTIRYCPQRGTWLTWDTYRWRWDAAGTVNELARTIARDLPTEDRTDERHRTSSLSRRGLDAMVAVARTDHRTTIPIDRLDARPYELNTPGGVVNLRTGALTPADPRALHTRSTTIAPDYDARSPRWDAFLADTFAGDPDLTAYMQRLLGVSLVGIVLEQLLPFAFGPGANGKTTMLGAVQRIIGIGDDGYSISAPAEMLLATHQQGHPTEIARLSGARVVVSSELEDGQRFAEARVKQLTGRDVISGRFMRQDWFSFVPTHTLWLLANTQPNVRAGGPAFWRRLRLLPFENTVPAERRIPDLEDRLVQDEGPAILAWLIRGAANYFAHGLADPTAVLAATDAYAADQDTVGRFVTEECETGDPNAQHMQVRASELRAAYERWCRAEGEEPVAPKSLGTALRSRYGVQLGRDATARFYSGIRLTDVAQDASSPEPDPSSDRGGWAAQEGW